MVRELTIEILGIDWYIEDKELLEKGESIDKDYSFINLEIYNGCITFIHNCIAMGVDEKFKTDKRFLEVCTFIYLEDEKEKERFQGTFIDALKYIQKVLNGR